MTVNWNDVDVRALEHDDIDAVVAYWHDPSNLFLDAMELDRALLPSPQKMKEQLTFSLRPGAQPSSLLTILCDGHAIGMHSLTDMEDGEKAVMHAHIWSDKGRGKGVGRISYVKAMGIYFDRYKLTSIEFRTPKSNAAANRIKSHLGLSVMGEVDYTLPILRRAIPAYLYILNAVDYAALVARTRLEFV